MKINFYILLVTFFFVNILSANENNYYLILKNNKVNVRYGPGFDYPINFVYKKKNFPVIILDKSGTWRKIIDFKNNSGWIHISQLSKKKSAINIKNNSVLYKKSTIYSKPIARLEVGRLVLIKKCKEKWCKITSGGFKGWVFESSLWGMIN